MYPRLVEIGGFELYTYGLLVAIGFIVGLSIAARLAARDGISRDDTWNLGLVVLVAALVGAKLLMIATEYQYYIARPSELFSLATLRSGGAFYGGLLFALAAAALYMRAKQMPGWKTADAFAPGIALGHSIGRLGCFSAGCCYGEPTDLPWGVVFTDRFANETIGVPLGISLHPTQLYEAGAELAIFFLLLVIVRRRRFDGEVILSYLIFYSAARFAIEYFRGDPRGFLFGGMLSTSQFLSILILPTALALYLMRGRSSHTYSPVKRS